MPAAPLRHPTTMSHCLQPHGPFPSPPDIPSKIPMPLPIMMTCFPSYSHTLCLLFYHHSPVSTYESPQSIILDPTSPYSFLDPYTHSESSDSDGFPPNSSGSGYEANSE